MMTTSNARDLARCETGIRGLDKVTGGGLPRQGMTLAVGVPGSGVSTLGMEFLVRGARRCDEQGLYLSFEERTRDLLTQFASKDWNLPQLIESGGVRLDEIGAEQEKFRTCRRPQCFDLDALLNRMERAINVAGADRVVLDGLLEFMNPEYAEPCIGQQEFRRLFRRLREYDVTSLLTCGLNGEIPAVRTAERRADCVLALDRQQGCQETDRRLEVRKYRGGGHGNRSYPFIITGRGISVLPTGSISLEYGVADERISTGVPGLDAMLGHAGFYRGSGVLVTGAAGTGKTTLGTRFVEAACDHGDRALYFSFEEPPREIIRNMKKVGVELERWLNQGILRLEAMRPAKRGLGGHILNILRIVEEFSPQVVVIDPLPDTMEGGEPARKKTMLTHLVDRLKKSGITALFTDLTPADHAVQAAQSHVASLMDTWVNLRNVRMYGRRSLLLEILKSRGTGHSRKEREMTIGEEGLRLADDGSDPAMTAGETGRRWMNARGLQ